MLSSKFISTNFISPNFIKFNGEILTASNNNPWKFPEEIQPDHKDDLSLFMLAVTVINSQT